jgi:membrane-associated phospholipid phosphatase
VGSSRSVRTPTVAEQPIPSGDRAGRAFDRIGLDAAPWRVGAVFAAGFACIVLVGVLAGTAVEAADGILFDEAAFMAALSADRSALMTDASALFGRFSDTWTVIGMASGAIVVLSLFGLGRQIVVLGGGLAIELAAYLTITYTVGRPRPSVDATASFPSTPSFPSGHVAAAVVLYGAMAVVVWSLNPSRPLRAGAVGVAVVVPSLVGVSRVYEGLHYPSDVAAGAVLGVSGLLVAVTAAGQVPVPTTPQVPVTSSDTAGRGRAEVSP